MSAQGQMSFKNVPALYPLGFVASGKAHSYSFVNLEFGYISSVVFRMLTS